MAKKFNIQHYNGLIVPVEYDTYDTRDLDEGRRIALNWEISKLKEEIKKLKTQKEQYVELASSLDYVSSNYLTDAKKQAMSLVSAIPLAYSGGNSSAYVSNAQSAYTKIGTDIKKIQNLLKDVEPIIKDIEEKIQAKETRLRQLLML